ncbi:hypothetical protein YC2023_067469 [Brassica napus]
MVTIIKALSDYVHSKRLKLGIYSDAEYIKEASEEMVELLKQLQQATQEADEARSSWPCL